MRSVLNFRRRYPGRQAWWIRGLSQACRNLVPGIGQVPQAGDGSGRGRGSTPAHEPEGKLIAIGGNEDKGKEPEGGHNTKVFQHNFIEEGILRRVVDEMGGTNARIAVITSASSIPDEVGENYIEAFGRLGVTNIDVLDIRERAE